MVNRPRRRSHAGVGLYNSRHSGDLESYGKLGPVMNNLQHFLPVLAR